MSELPVVRPVGVEVEYRLLRRCFVGRGVVLALLLLLSNLVFYYSIEWDALTHWEVWPFILALRYLEVFAFPQVLFFLDVLGLQDLVTLSHEFPEAKTLHRSLTGKEIQTLLCLLLVK